MEPEVNGEVKIQVLSSELKVARLAYSEEAGEKGCYDKELSKMMMKKVSKTTNSTTSVTLNFNPQDLISVLRMVHRHAKYMYDLGRKDQGDDYMSIHNKMETQAVYQGLAIR